MNVLILGANGFIGSHLSEAILETTDWHITALDLNQDKLAACIDHPRFDLTIGDMTQATTWLNDAIQKADVVLPLVAIATPAMYVQNPLRVFELDFEANLAVIRLCVEHHKRIIFPSTSEVYGMCPDPVFDEIESSLVTGPINKERWIYSTSKQLLDRLIYAYGKHHGLDYALFRPFNWYGPRLDNVFNPKPGGSRVLTQFIGNILRGENIHLVDGGSQQRCFTYISDGVDALIKIIRNEDNKAHNQIFNVGNPDENVSIRELAESLLALVQSDYPKYAAAAKEVKLVDIDAKAYYGSGYQDVTLRVPAINHAKEYLKWQPEIDLKTGLKSTLDAYLT